MKLWPVLKTRIIAWLGSFKPAARQGWWRELSLDTLEPRVLFSGAPVEAPAAEEEQAAGVSQSPEDQAIPMQQGLFGDQTGSDQNPIAQESPVALVSAGEVSGLLNEETLATIAAAAKQRWIASGITAEQLVALDSVTYGIADLGSNRLGVAAGGVITIDDDAASRGWFVDATPLDDAEFLADGVRLSRESVGIDLLTLVMHEQGHVLGLYDAVSGTANVMSGVLNPGERRLILAGQAAGATPLSLAGDHFSLTTASVIGTTLTYVSDAASDHLRVRINGANFEHSLDGVTFFVSGTTAGVTAIAIDMGAGNDTVTIQALGALGASLTIDGGSGNDTVNFAGDLTFAAGLNVDVDLQNDAAAGDVDTVNFTANSNVILSGAGAATVRASGNISFASGSSLETVDGALIVEANLQGTATTGNFVGVDVNGALIRATGTGDVTVQGKGGTNAAGSQAGVQVRAGGDILGGTGGTLTVAGTGGISAGNDNRGVFVTGAGSSISSSGANVIVSGTGGGTGNVVRNEGVSLAAGGGISAGGAGSVTVTGQGGLLATNSSGANHGVYATGSNSAITSNGGNVTVTGTGGGAGSAGQNDGVRVETAGRISSGVDGTVTVTGFGGNTSNGGFSFGVIVIGASSTISSGGGGAVSVNGTGGGGSGGAGNRNDGVRVESGGRITSGTGASVTVTGQGGLGTANNANVGVHVIGTNSTITSGGGNVSVSGTGGGTGSSGSNFGIYVENFSRVTATGNGTVTLSGLGGNAGGTGSSNLGIWHDTDSIIDSSGGAVLVTGTGRGNGGANLGVGIFGRAVITAGGLGTVTVLGQGSLTGTNGGHYGVDNRANIASGGGNVTVIGTGGGSGAGASGNGVDISSIGLVTAGGNGTVTIIGQGSQGGSGSDSNGVFVSSALSVTSNGGNVSVTGTGGGVGSVTTGNNGVRVQGIINAGANGTVTVQGQGGSGANSDGITLPTAQGNITSNGGNVIVTGTGGGHASGTGANDGISLFSAAAGISAGGNGTLTVTGSGGLGGGNNIGVNHTSINTRITSNGGNVMVTGTGGTGNGSFNSGISLSGSNGAISAGGNGTVTVVGQGGLASSGDSHYGVQLRSTSQITSNGGAVVVTGTGGGNAGTSARNHGIYIEAGTITAGGTASVSVTGTGGNTAGTAGLQNRGVYVEASTSLITSGGGNVTVTGTGGGSGTGGENDGVNVLSGTITAGGNGTVTIMGSGGNTGGSAGNSNRGVYAGSGLGANITSNGGSVSVTGTGGGSGTGGSNAGVAIGSRGTISSGANATVTLAGQGGNAGGTGTQNHGVFVSGDAFGVATLTTGGGNLFVTGTEGGSASVAMATGPFASVTTATNGGLISFTGNSMDLATGSTIATQAAGTVTLRQRSNGVAINLGTAGDPNAGPLNLSDAELDRITTGTMHIGDASSGNLTVTANITRPAATAMNLRSGAAIVFGNGSLNAAGGNVSLDVGTIISPPNVGADLAAGNVTFGSGDTLAIVINGLAPDTQYSQLNANANIDLTGLSLSVTGAFVPVIGQTFTIINNTGAGTMSGTFAGLAEGGTIVNFLGSGLNATITYVGGTGNDVVLTTVSGNLAPVGVDDTGIATEAGGTLNGMSGTDATGNVTANDIDSDILVVTAIRTGAVEGAGTTGAVGSALGGQYGSLTLNANGTYSYVVNEGNAAVEALAIGESLTDRFNYTISDGSLTDIAVLSITVNGANDAPVASSDTGNATAATNGSGDVLGNDNDLDLGAGALSVTSIRTGGVEGAGLAGTVGTPLAGLYGSLTLNADGSYTYAVNGAHPAVAALSGAATLTDRFNYTVSDGDLSDEAILSIRISALPLPPGLYTTEVSLDGTGNLLITDILGGNTNDTLFIGVDAGWLIVRDPNHTVGHTVGGLTRQESIHEVRVRLADISGDVIVQSLAGDDVIQLGNLNDLPGGVRIDAGLGFDRIFLGQGTTALSPGANMVMAAETIRIDRHSLSTAGPGGIELRAEGSGAAHFQGLELIDSSLNVMGTGSIMLVGVGGAAPGYNEGLRLYASSIATAVGDILLRGTGGSGTGNSAGVAFYGESTATAGGAGTLRLEGTGGDAGSSPGVDLAPGSVLSVVDGNLMIEGTGGTLGNQNSGIALKGSELRSLGAGDILLTGTGSGTGQNNAGVLVSETTVSAAESGSIIISGTGSVGGSQSNEGIVLSGGSLLSTGRGMISLSGTGGGSGSHNSGVFISRSTLRSGDDGDITIAGTGAVSAAGSYNQGIALQLSEVESQMGAVRFNGLGGSGTSYNYGLRLLDARVRTAGVSSMTGRSLQSTTGFNNIGIQVQSGSLVEGGVNSEFLGFGGGGSRNNHGILWDANSITTLGTDAFTGISGSGTNSMALKGGLFA